jgi:Cu+-exporting ATPase
VERCEAALRRWGELATSSLIVAVEGEVVGALALSDPVRPDASVAVAALRKLGVDLALVTGDRLDTARAVAREVGVDVVHAQMLPADKLEVVVSHRDGRVAFVGDGINDAPALARADVGIAVGTGADIAVEAGDLVLMRRDLSLLPEAVAMSRRTARVIRQNFFWAYAYNVALIPVAAGVLYPLTHVRLSPVLAALAMSLSSVIVVTNSLRLRRGGHWPMTSGGGG